MNFYLLELIKGVPKKYELFSSCAKLFELFDNWSIGAAFATFKRADVVGAANNTNTDEAVGVVTAFS